MGSTHIHGAFQILFLNKLDLFTEKVQHSDIKAVFPDYDGESVLFYKNGYTDTRPQGNQKIC
jgi:hypothetical protein